MEVAKDSQSRLIKGEVIAIGPKVRSDVSVGECVVFTQVCKEALKGSFGPDLMLIRDMDLAGIVPRDVKVTDGRSPAL